MSGTEWFMLGVHWGVFFCGFFIVLSLVGIVAVIALNIIEWAFDKFMDWRDRQRRMRAGKSA